MKTFNDLEILGDKEELLRLLSLVQDNLPHNWRYKEDNSQSYSKNTGKSLEEVLCIESPEINSKKGLVWFGLWKDRIKVTNIVPHEPGLFTYDEYNSILDEFLNECINPIIGDLDLELNYKTDGINIEEKTGKQTFGKMKAWESACNHSTGNTHPADFRRWADFVITAHRENSELTSDLFQRWLIEEKGWNEEFDITNRLILEYEYSRDLLEEYDKH